MENIIPFVDKSIEYFYFLFRQKLLFFIIFLFVATTVFFNSNNEQSLHYGEVDVYEGGSNYFSKLDSIQENIAPLSRLKIDFLSKADIGFGIKESKFSDRQNNLIRLDRPPQENSIVIENKFDIFKNELNNEYMFAKYFSIATRKENQSIFLNNFFEDEELIKKYGLTNDSEIVSEFANKNFVVTYFELPSDINKLRPYLSRFQRLKIGLESSNKKYILPVLIEFSKYINNILNEDIERTVISFINSNKQMISFQQDLLREQLSILRDNYDVLLEDELTKLQENLLIAKSLNYQKSYFYQEFNITQNEKYFDYVSHCASGQTALYCMGYEALKKEIDSLLERKDPKPFIKGYREIEAALNQLDGASIASIAETLTSEYDFSEYKEYVELDQYSITYQKKNTTNNNNNVVILFGIILFLLIALINKIYKDAKKNNQESIKL